MLAQFDSVQNTTKCRRAFNKLVSDLATSTLNKYSRITPWNSQCEKKFFFKASEYSPYQSFYIIGAQHVYAQHHPRNVLLHASLCSRGARELRLISGSARPGATALVGLWMYSKGLGGVSGWLGGRRVPSRVHLADVLVERAAVHEVFAAEGALKASNRAVRLAVVVESSDECVLLVAHLALVAAPVGPVPVHVALQRLLVEEAPATHGASGCRLAWPLWRACCRTCEGPHTSFHAHR